MRAIHPVRHPATVRAELNAGTNDVAVTGHFGLVVWHKLRRQHLELQRHHQPLIEATRAQADKTFAGRFHRPGDQRLLSVEVGQAIGVGLFGPVGPEFLQQMPKLVILGFRPRRDAGADQVADPLVDNVEGVRVVAHCCAGTRAEIS
ncbi:hypothetical protein D3C81_1586350 [compost metagenome]